MESDTEMPIDSPKQDVFIVKGKHITAFSSIFVVMGLILMITMSSSIQVAIDSNSWVSVEGEITSSEVVSETRGSGGDKETKYYAEVSYTFNVNGRDYTGNTIYAGDIRPSGIIASNAYVEEHQAGQAVTVYYDAEDPNNNCLEPGITFGHVGFALMGLVFFSVALFGAIKGIKRWNEVIIELPVKTR
ncbi:MAG: DUF3592 domain-containing protein [Candidatus Heimdallarchaeota archaeon]|nr:DUF3592 domain-containing protein [Candidatus Heimdallarchaeota archaeon]